MSRSVINLKEEFGETFKIEYEDGHSGKENDEAVFQLIPCKFGSIQPWDDQRSLLAYCNKKKLSRRLRKEISSGMWAGFKVLVQGDYELRFTFPVNRIEEVAGILKAKRKRRLSLEHKEKLIEGLVKYKKEKLEVA